MPRSPGTVESSHQAGFCFQLNHETVTVHAPPATRLSAVLREQLGLTGTKVGCDAGDCGACTVLLDGQQVCACLVPVAQVHERAVSTVEGLARDGQLTALQQSFHDHGAAQCGICTPGMLMAASTLLGLTGPVSEGEVCDALGGVLCRCTGYRKIVHAVLAVVGEANGSVGLAGTPAARMTEPAPQSVMGARIPAVDGIAKVTGATRFGADQAPADALWLRAVRSPHAHARFELGDWSGLHARFPGLVRILTAADVPGRNGYGVYPDCKDQPVFADGVVRYRGESVAAIVGDAFTVRHLTDDCLPLAWETLPAQFDPRAAVVPSAPLVNPVHDSNVLVRGRLRFAAPAADAVESAAAAIGAASLVEVGGEFETGYVEHAYIEPEAGYAAPLPGGRIEVSVCTQTPYMDRDEVAGVLGISCAQVRIRPPACGGGFGGKLDQSLQPLLAVAAWVLGRPVRAVFSRTESMVATTKRHPARMQVRATADRHGYLRSYQFDGDFNTGIYASWGPTVAGRVPVHCMGPYRVPRVVADSRAVFTNGPSAGAFRGFGVPQAAIAHEALMDELAAACGIDALEIRHRNALRAGDRTATGQLIEASAGLADCLDALRPAWAELRAAARAFNQSATAGPLRRGVGLACMWYGCGNTGMSNPSTMRVRLLRDGRIVYHNGAQDIGQGSYTVLLQILAEAAGIAPEHIEMVVSDTDLTDDAGKTSASRQTFVSGRAAQLAGADLRAQILQLANVGPNARIELDGPIVRLLDEGHEHRVDLAQIPMTVPATAASAVSGASEIVLEGVGTFDPPTSAQDENGQGAPYATYGFAAQIAQVEVDLELGTVTVLRLVAAHDVGAAVNPTLVEGQIEGGVAQGIGLALMEEYLPGRTDNLHDYLIPSIGDVPEVESLLIEDPEPLGPFGAKGIGEPALIPTAPAILGAIHDATGVRIRRVPVLPHRLYAAIMASERGIAR